MTPGNVLTEVTETNLAKAAGRNHAAWISALGRLANVDLHVESDAVWTIARRPSRHNHVFAMRFSEDSVDGRLRQILDPFRRARLAANLWQDSDATPKDLTGALRTRGLRCTKHCPALAADLATVNVDDGLSPPSGITLEVVRDFSSFEGAVHPFLGPVTSPSRRARLDAYRELAAQNLDAAWHCQAIGANCPVGVGTLFGSAGVAGVYDVGVVESERGRGVGTAITCRLLEHARNLGYRAAVLLASGMAEGLYRRLGFRRVTTISHWLYSRSQQRRDERGEELGT